MSLTPSGANSNNISTNQHAISLKYRWTCFQYKRPNLTTPYTRYFHSTTEYYTNSLPGPNPAPKSLTADRLEALLQMQKTDPFCKQISKHLSNRKACHHESDFFTHVRGLLYKHITDSGQRFLALVIPKYWEYTVLAEAHDKLGHQGNTHTKCLIKCQYHWKGMSKDIQKLKIIINCFLEDTTIYD